MTDDNNVLRKHGQPPLRVGLTPEARALMAREYGMTEAEVDAEMEHQNAVNGPREGESAKAFLLRTCREIVDDMNPQMNRQQRRAITREMVKRMRQS